MYHWRHRHIAAGHLGLVVHRLAGYTGSPTVARMDSLPQTHCMGFLLLAERMDWTGHNRRSSDEQRQRIIPYTSR